MKKANVKIVANSDEEEGYTSDSDEDLKLQSFKSKFQARLKKAAIVRTSDAKVTRHFRRIDSLARLLEGNSICAAVYYHAETKELWLANNKVHATSRPDNDQITTMKSVFSLVSEEHLSIETILERLTNVICLNFAQEKRFEQAKLNSKSFDIKAYVSEILKDMFKSGHATKVWMASAIKNMEEEDDIKNAIALLIKKTTRIARDFLKLRDFLLKENLTDPIAQGLLKAIREQKIKIIHCEGKDVHAEMRIVANQLSKPSNGETYIGISKLCCDHCSLAMQAFGIKSRGLHGQSAKWPIPSFISSNHNNLTKYMGDAAYLDYQGLSKLKQKESLDYVASKESNPTKENARHGRSMYADTSDSDIEFGLNMSDDEDAAADVEEFPLADVWTLRHITYFHPKEFDRLQKIGLSMKEIIHLYKEPKEKFDAMGSEHAYALIQRLSENESGDNESEVFDKLSDIFDDNENLFWRIVEDDNELVVNFGLKEVCDRYNEKAANKHEDDREGEHHDYDSYDEVGDELVEDNGWDYVHDSDDSENEWKHKDRDSASGSEQENNCDNNSESASSDDNDLDERFSAFRI